MSLGLVRGCTLGSILVDLSREEEDEEAGKGRQSFCSVVACYKIGLLCFLFIKLQVLCRGEKTTELSSAVKRSDCLVCLEGFGHQF